MNEYGDLYSNQSPVKKLLFAICSFICLQGISKDSIITSGKYRLAGQLGPGIHTDFDWTYVSYHGDILIENRNNKRLSFGMGGGYTTNFYLELFPTYLIVQLNSNKIKTWGLSSNIKCGITFQELNGSIQESPHSPSLYLSWNIGTNFKFEKHNRVILTVGASLLSYQEIVTCCRTHRPDGRFYGRTYWEHNMILLSSFNVRYSF
ncbi:MAG: hypothetical protein MRY83_12485 [Flavobacteriales bacterium]|nr:hypothetical protein [Flavobacteriales bacterium]